jgi:hypothetical protein
MLALLGKNVTHDTTPVTLVVEPAEKYQMSVPPRPKEASALTREVLLYRIAPLVFFYQIATIGCMIVVGQIYSGNPYVQITTIDHTEFAGFSRNCLRPHYFTENVTNVNDCFDDINCAYSALSEPLLCAYPAERSLNFDTASRDFVVEFGNLNSPEASDGSVDTTIAQLHGFTFESWNSDGGTGTLYAHTTCESHEPCRLGNWSYDRDTGIVMLGNETMVKPCSSGSNNLCWTQEGVDEFPNMVFPSISLVYNGAAWAYRVRQTAGFMIFIFGELAFLFTVRTEQWSWEAFKTPNHLFYIFSFLGLLLVWFFLSVPIVSFSMDLSASTWDVIGITLLFTSVLPLGSDFAKYFYRKALDTYYVNLWKDNQTLLAITKGSDPEPSVERSSFFRRKHS